MTKLNTLKRQSVRGALAFAAVLLVILALTPAAPAQSAAPATVSGRVTDGERAAAGITVILFSGEASQRFRAIARTKTDAEGRFLMSNIPPGRYQIMPDAPAYVVAELGLSYPPGRPLNLVAGDEVKDMDFKIEPGGVVTGRVTDADGNPVVAEPILLTPVEEGKPPRYNIDLRDQMTDDRGVYRLYGLSPGRYRVSVGRADDSGAISFGRRKLFRRTFYPDTTEQAQARIVEVKAGIESTDIDITVGRALKTYKVSGRFVTADTNQSVPDILIGFGIVDARGRQSGNFGGNTQANSRGEFQADGLTPGRYVAYATNTIMQEATEFYSEPVTFDVTDSDVSGLLIKLKRGATISGVVTIEGVSDQNAAAQMLSAVRVYGFIQPDSLQLGAASPSRPVNVNPDGTFLLRGLSPGKLRLGALAEAVKGLTATRIELNGANILSGYELTSGVQVTGVRIVMTYGIATLVGQASFVNGTPPAGARIMAAARLVNSPPSAGAGRSVEVDARGYFRMEGLPPGEYEIVVNVFAFTPGSGGRSTPLRVVLSDGVETKVAPVINFQPKERKEP